MDMEKAGLKEESSVKLPAIEDAQKKFKEERPSKSANLDNDSQPSLKATASQPQLRRSSLGSIPKLA